MADTGFNRPTLTELIDRAESDVNSRIPGADSRLRRSFLNVLARILAGYAHGFYGYLDFIARQGIPDTAEEEFIERWSTIWGVSRKPAERAEGQVDFTGNNGVVIDANTVLVRGDDVKYKVKDSVIISGGTATADIIADQGGEDANAVDQTQLSFVTPVTGVDVIAVMNGDTEGGLDGESDVQLRGRLLTRIQEPPHGGADFDYEAWALEVPGVTRAFVAPQELGIGTVTVRILSDDLTVDGIPTPALVAEAQEYIESQRPVTAELFVVAPIANPIDFDIRLRDENADPVVDPVVRAEVVAEITDLIRRESVPGGTLFLSRINEAISIAVGEFDHVLVSPTADVVAGTGIQSTLGTVTWL